MGSCGSDREMNLDYRLTPTKCRFGSRVLQKTVGKNDRAVESLQPVT